MNEELDLRVHIYSISTPEHRALRNAAEDAEQDEQVTWLVQGGKRIAAIVPVAVAEHALEEAETHP